MTDSFRRLSSVFALRLNRPQRILISIISGSQSRFAIFRLHIARGGHTHRLCTYFDTDCDGIWYQSNPFRCYYSTEFDDWIDHAPFRTAVVRCQWHPESRDQRHPERKLAHARLPDHCVIYGDLYRATGDVSPEPNGSVIESKLRDTRISVGCSLRDATRIIEKCF